MLEPARARSGCPSISALNPSRVGVVFGVAAVAATALHPVFGRLADRWGGRRLTMIGLVVTALVMPLLSRAWNFQSAIALYVLMGAALALVVTPSLAYMAEATSAAGVESFGVCYGVYNFAWGSGCSAGPAIGGFPVRTARICAAHAGLDAAGARHDDPAGQEVRRKSRVPTSEEVHDSMSRIVAVLTAALPDRRSRRSRISRRRQGRRTRPRQVRGRARPVVSIFGGKAAREGVKSTVAVKGDRKITHQRRQRPDRRPRRGKDLRARRQEEDLHRDDLRRAAAADGGGAQEGRGRRARRTQEEKPAEAPPIRTSKEIEVDFDVKETGQKKAINGFDTHQAIMTITLREKGKTLEQSGGLVITSDMWLAPRIAAMKEIAEFELRYAQALQGPMVTGASPEQMAAALAMYPMLKDGLARMRAEAREARRHGHPDDDDGRGGEVRGADGGGEEVGRSREPSERLRRRRRSRRRPGPPRSEGQARQPKTRATFMTITQRGAEGDDRRGRRADVGGPGRIQANKVGRSASEVRPT